MREPGVAQVLQERGMSLAKSLGNRRFSSFHGMAPYCIREISSVGN